MKHLKKTLLPLAAAALLLVSLAACGSNNADPSTNDGSADTPSSNQEGATGDTVAKEDCSSVYAEIIAVNGSHLSVSAGDQVLDLTVKDDILTKWTQGDQVILYYTGDFGEDMQVRYIDKWTAVFWTESVQMGRPVRWTGRLFGAPRRIISAEGTDWRRSHPSALCRFGRRPDYR